MYKYDDSKENRQAARGNTIQRTATPNVTEAQILTKKSHAHFHYTARMMVKAAFGDGWQWQEEVALHTLLRVLVFPASTSPNYTMILKTVISTMSIVHLQL